MKKYRYIVTTKEIFEHGNNNILYNLVRSKRQKTSELIIENENEITLRVPFDKSLEEIREIIQKKMQWILKKQDEYRKSKPEIKERSEERRVGKESRSGRTKYHEKKKI